QDTVTLVVRMLNAAVKTMRDVHDQIDEEDPTTADILHGFIEKLEQYAWMVDAENMTPTANVTEPAAV
ncbi:ferritin-like domain-containing protein, partial [Arthrobacter sp. H41]